MSISPITKAIGKHGEWKQKLTTAIDNGAHDLSPEQLEPDNLCEFGRWLESLTLAEKKSDHFQKVKALHANFHKEAAKIVRLIKCGKKREATQCMDLKGSFTTTSSQLTIAMMNWKKELDK
jgi:hypothetical protein